MPKKTTTAPQQLATWITQPILRARGWTDTAIRNFLPDPEAYRKNPHYSSAGAPMPLWTPPTVAAAEARPDWQAWLEKSLNRRKTTLAALAYPDGDASFLERLDHAQTAIDEAAAAARPKRTRRTRTRPASP